MTIKPSKPGAAFAWRFHYGTRLLRRAYESSRAKADAEVAKIESQAAEFEKRVIAGEASWVEVDEENYPVYDYGEALGEALHEEETVLALIRGAYVISLYHFFEQQIGDRLNGKNFTHEKGIAWLKNFGWTPLESELNELRLAANCAKHSAGKSASDLYVLRPDMFDASKIRMGFEPGYDSLALTDAHVDAFFDAMKRSVPSNLGIAL